MRFGSADSNYIDVAPYSVNNVPQGVSFDGTGAIRLQPQGELLIRNYSANQDILNQIQMASPTSDNRYIYISNRKTNGSTANAINFMVNSTDGTRLSLYNYRTDTNNLANLITMNYSAVGSRNLELDNYDAGNEVANQIRLSSVDGIKIWSYHDQLSIGTDDGIITITSGSLNNRKAIYIFGSALYFNGSQKW